MGGSAVTRIRLAEAGDAEAIGRIQVEAWRAAYAQILPPGFLASLDATARASQWHDRIGERAHPNAPTFVALDERDAVRGFAHTGPVRDDDLRPDGRAEIYTVYVDPERWRHGAGSDLMRAIDDFWLPTEVHELTLWVFEENQLGRAFYERLGWQPDGARQVDDFGGVHPAEIRLRRRLG